MERLPEYDPRYVEGVELFNAGDYFLAHEVWEQLWRDCNNSSRRFYQSLIQAAVALYHHERANRTGAARLAQAGAAKALAYPTVYLGLAVAEFWFAVAQYLQESTVDRPTIVLQDLVDHSPGANHE